MRIKNLLLLFMFWMAGLLNAQEIQLFPFAGYSFADKFKIDGGTAMIREGITYGGALSWIASDRWAIEISYLRMKSTMEATGYYEGDDFGFADEIHVNYILLGGSRLFRLAERTNLFSGVNVGVGIFHSIADRYSTMARFAAGVDAGINHFFNKNLGVRVQANLNFPFTEVGDAFGWNGGHNGSSAGVTGVVPFVQPGFTAGLVLKIK